MSDTVQSDSSSTDENDSETGVVTIPVPDKYSPIPVTKDPDMAEINMGDINLASYDNNGNVSNDEEEERPDKVTTLKRNRGFLNTPSAGSNNGKSFLASIRRRDITAIKKLQVKHLGQW